MKQQDYYEILGVRRDAAFEEIVEAYREMIQRFHPDLHPHDSKEAADLLGEKTKAVNEAYDTLKDTTKRREYDERTFGRHSAEEPASRASESGYRAEEPTSRPKAEAFRRALQAIFNDAKDDFVVVTSGDLHRLVGGYPGRNHNMAGCCSVMMNMRRPGDRILAQPPSGKGATLTIRYVLPR